MDSPAASPDQRPGLGVDLARELGRELTRVLDRLRGLGPARLTAAAPAAYALAQRLEDAAASLEGRPSRPLPRLADHALADQVAVTGHDLIAALAAAPAAAPAAAVQRVAGDALRDLAEARRALP